MAQPGGSHALVFRIMRLARPSLPGYDPLRFDLDRDFISDVSAASAPQLPSALPASYPFAGRVQMGDPAASSEPNGTGLSDMLSLPQSFGLVHLGEAFQAYVTVCNYSNQPVSNVAVKVELQSENSKAVLYDNTPSPVVLLQPGQRHDFVIKHDIKELGPHTLACSSVYSTASAERKYLPQHFRFVSANPMVVRTRHRLVGPDTLLEITLENATKGPMVLELVQFQPQQPFTCAPITAGAASVGGKTVPGQRGWSAAGAGGPLGEYLRDATIVAEGGASSFLFKLCKAAPIGAGASPPRSPLGSQGAGALVLGRLEIRWRGPMGQMARLQTQAITAPAPLPKDLSLSLSHLPPRLVVGQPFPLGLAVTNGTDRLLGPLRVRWGGGAATGAGAAGGVVAEGGAAPSACVPAGVVVDGPESVIVDAVPPRQAVQAELHMVALSPGQHVLEGVVLEGERDGRQYDMLPREEIFVLPPMYDELGTAGAWDAREGTQQRAPTAGHGVCVS